MDMNLISLAAAALLAQQQQPNAIALFNGRDLTNFYTYLGPKPGEKEPLGKNNDPLRVFTVHDGMIHVSGQVFGYVATEREFENFQLTVEYKWGEKTWPPRKDKGRDSGLLFHMVGPDKVWPKSIEYQIMEGMTGEIILVDGASMDFDESFRDRLRNKNGLTPDGKRIRSGGVRFYGRTSEWKDVIGYRGKDDLEKPVGDWNLLELICDRGAFTYLLNGKVAVKGTGAEPSKGRFLLQSEGAEIFFRKVELLEKR